MGDNCQCGKRSLSICGHKRPQAHLQAFECCVTNFSSHKYPQAHLVTKACCYAAGYKSQHCGMKLIKNDHVSNSEHAQQHEQANTSSFKCWSTLEASHCHAHSCRAFAWQRCKNFAAPGIAKPAENVLTQNSKGVCFAAIAVQATWSCFVDQRL